MEWVATRGGVVRHPIDTGFEGEEAKALLCRERPLLVHVCTPEEEKVLKACWRCRDLIELNNLNDQL